MESERARALTGGPKVACTTSEDTRNKRTGRKFQSTRSFVWIKRKLSGNEVEAVPLTKIPALRSEGGHAVLTRACLSRTSKPEQGFRKRLPQRPVLLLSRSLDRDNPH